MAGMTRRTFAAALLALACCLSAAGCGVDAPTGTDAPPASQEAAAQGAELTSTCTLYIGTTGQRTQEPVMDVEQARAAVGELALKHASGYTIYLAKGGWVDSETAEAYEEDTLVVVLMGATDEDALALAREAAELLDQKSVMVEHGQSRVEYVEG